MRSLQWYKRGAAYGNIANITNEDDKGWSYSEKKLTRSQRRQLSEEGIVEIKRYEK